MEDMQGTLLEANKRTEIFSAPIAPAEIERTLADNADSLRRIAHDLHQRGTRERSARSVSRRPCRSSSGSGVLGPRRVCAGDSRQLAASR